VRIFTPRHLSIFPTEFATFPGDFDLATSANASNRHCMTYPFPGVDGVIPSATVVIFRNCPAGGAPELLMVQRAKEMRFAGGAAVFPGGRVDPEDGELALQIGPEADIEELSARIAAVRETLEETGLAVGLANAVSATEASAARAFLLEQGALAPVLERHSWALAPDLLVPFARWCPGKDGTFDARFYLADLGTGAVDITVDATENTRLFWASAAQALAMADAHEISVIFPTRRNLERLALFSSFAEARAHAEAIPVVTVTPHTIERAGEPWLAIPDFEARGYPVEGQPLSEVKRG
jgi:8-oxo-dGTP pyrophosphatase MutT (NUDIX family)